MAYDIRFLNDVITNAYDLSLLNNIELSKLDYNHNWAREYHCSYKERLDAEMTIGKQATKITLQTQSTADKSEETKNNNNDLIEINTSSRAYVKSQSEKWKWKIRKKKNCSKFCWMRIRYAQTISKMLYTKVARNITSYGFAGSERKKKLWKKLSAHRLAACRLWLSVCWLFFFIFRCNEAYFPFMADTLHIIRHI